MLDKGQGEAFRSMCVSQKKEQGLRAGTAGDARHSGDAEKPGSWSWSSTWIVLNNGCAPGDLPGQGQATPVPAALTGRACCCRMMGADRWRLLSSSARSVEFSASSTE